MKTQQEAEKKEQQRIKDLVLNYDLRENEDPDGEPNLAPLIENTNIHNIASSGSERPNHYHHNRSDNRSGKDRSGQRVRKLQLSDVDWYDKSEKPKMYPAPHPESTIGCDDKQRPGGFAAGGACARSHLADASMSTLRAKNSSTSRSRQ